jgi:hypothetical protein
MRQNALVVDETQVVRDWRLETSVGMVLRGQGADPDKIRARHPRLVQIAERALDEGLSLIVPQLAFRRLPVRFVRDESVRLEGGGGELRGPAVADFLATSESVVLAVTTLGGKLERRVAEITQRDLLLGMALDGFGTAALEVLGAAAQRYFADLAADEGLRATIPLHPGMRGWELQHGQEQIFRLLDAFTIGVVLGPSFVMRPQKSMSMAVGLGRNVKISGRSCDLCTSADTCRHKPSCAVASS